MNDLIIVSLIIVLLFIWLLVFKYIKKKTIDYKAYIDSKNSELVTTNKTLEDRVVQRTEELKEATDQLEELERTDTLTDIHNSYSIMKILDTEVDRAKRYGNPLTVFMYDVDHFKRLNDTHGSRVGDDILYNLTKVVKDSLRDIDIVGTAQQGNDVAIFRNEGDNPIVWTKIIIDPFFQGAWPGFVYDIDSDGDIDIVAGASWADKLAWWESDLNQKPLTPERPSGSASGRPNIEYSYSSNTIDPQGDNIFYLFNWGDGNDSGWIGPFSSGETCEATYSWENQGNYGIKVKAKDIFGSESYWSDPLSVSMPKTKSINEFNPWIFRLIQRFPILEFLL